MSVSDLDAALQVRRMRHSNRTLLAVALLFGTAAAGLAQTATLPPTTSTSTPLTQSVSPQPTIETSSTVNATNMAHQQARAKSGHQSALPPRERHVLIGLLTLCFIVLSTGSHLIWRKSLGDFDRRS